MKWIGGFWFLRGVENSSKREWIPSLLSHPSGKAVSSLCSRAMTEPAGQGLQRLNEAAVCCDVTGCHRVTSSCHSGGFLPACWSCEELAAGLLPQPVTTWDCCELTSRLSWGADVMRWHHNSRDRWRHAMTSRVSWCDDVTEWHHGAGGRTTARPLRAFSALPYIAASGSRPQARLAELFRRGLRLARAAASQGRCRTEHREAIVAGAAGGGGRRRSRRVRPRWGGGREGRAGAAGLEPGPGPGRDEPWAGRSPRLVLRYPPAAARAEPGRPTGRCPGPAAPQGRGGAAGPGPSSSGRAPRAARAAVPAPREPPRLLLLLSRSRVRPVRARRPQSPVPGAPQDRALRVPLGAAAAGPGSLEPKRFLGRSFGKDVGRMFLLGSYINSEIGYGTCTFKLFLSLHQLALAECWDPFSFCV